MRVDRQHEGAQGDARPMQTPLHGLAVGAAAEDARLVRREAHRGDGALVSRLLIITKQSKDRKLRNDEKLNVKRQKKQTYPTHDGLRRDHIKHANVTVSTTRGQHVAVVVEAQRGDASAAGIGSQHTDQTSAFGAVRLQAARTAVGAADATAAGARQGGVAQRGRVAARPP